MSLSPSPITILSLPNSRSLTLSLIQLFFNTAAIKAALAAQKKKYVKKD